MDYFNLFFFISSIFLPIFLLGVILLVSKGKLLKSRIQKVVFFNLTVFLFLLSLAFSIGETYYRFVFDTTDSFAINMVSKRWKTKYYQLNNRNLRDQIDYEDQKKKEHRFTFYGDSFTVGYGIKNVSNRYINILRNNTDWEIHSIAQEGFNSNYHLEALRYMKSSPYEFDNVVLAYCLNDIDQFIPYSKEVYKRIQSFNSSMTYLEKNSFLINMLSFRWFAKNDKDYLNYSDFTKEAYHPKSEAWEQQKLVLVAISNFCKKNKIKLRVVTFPYFQTPYKDYEFKKAHQLLNEFWNSLDVPHLDLLDSYKTDLGNKLTVNAYDAHPNEKAHQIAADEINYFLEKSLD